MTFANKGVTLIRIGAACVRGVCVQLWFCEEFERDTLVARLSSGLAAAKNKTRERTQTGDKKVQGSKSTLEIRTEGLEEGTQQEDAPRRGYDYRTKFSRRGRNGGKTTASRRGALLHPPGLALARVQEGAGRFSLRFSPDG
jgi:hypothetical protein